MELSESEIFGDVFEKTAEIARAIEGDCFNDVHRLLETRPALAASALPLAIAKDNLAIAANILEHYGNALTPTAALSAATSGSNEAVALLLDSGWNVNAPCQLGQPMLSFAISNRSSVEYLLSRGANPNAGAPIDHTPLSAAVRTGDAAIVETLIQAGGDCTRGQLAHIAVETSNMEMLRVLHGHKAPLDAIEFENHLPSLQFRADFQRGTPLHLACERGDLEIVKFLIQNGADCDKCDTKGRTSRQVAKLLGELEICAYIDKQCELKDRNHKL